MDPNLLDLKVIHQCFIPVWLLVMMGWSLFTRNMSGFCKQEKEREREEKSPVKVIL